MISVIVPVHDEEAVLPRCLRRLTAGTAPEALDLVVVCNACSDRSAEIARSFPFPIRVVETSVASKTNAWNLGDEAARGFPRFYVDADVELAWPAIARVAAALDEPGVLAAAPAIEVDTSGSSLAVRGFYRVWQQLPYLRTGMIGSGVFALSREGRARFERFPDVIADDDFVRRLFRPTERRSVPECSFKIFAPGDLDSLIRIKTRSRLGRLQLDQGAFPGSEESGHSSHVRGAVRLAASPRLWGALAIYAFVTLATRWRARRQAEAGAFGGWERDDSSRRNVRAES